jgi:hypothetical protein
MGALIPIGQGADAEIKEKLNSTFSFDNLAALQGNIGTEDLFDANHHLHRVAYRLGCFPALNHTEKARRKWFYFLKRVLTAANVNGHVTAAVIKKQLQYALQQGATIQRVVFEAVEDTNAPAHYVYPDNWTEQVHGTTLSILLMCPGPLKTGNQDAVPDQPGDMDLGEQHLPF